MYTIKEMAKISHVTPKMLYHYHEIGLLEPAEIGENGYRYYGETEIERLQEILIYRKMDFSLTDIKRILDKNKEEKRLNILEQQLQLVKEKMEEMEQVIRTIEKTIEVEKGLSTMKDKERFDGLGEENIYSTLQNFTIIFIKPFLVFLLILFVYIFYNGIGILINGFPEGKFFIEGASIIVERIYMTAILFFVTGGIILSIKVLFFTKTKDLLDVINKKNKK